ncbi:MAG: hypothetical protein AB7F19_03540 [Candidatus Babeliales bacterium]
MFKKLVVFLGLGFAISSCANLTAVDKQEVSQDTKREVAKQYIVAARAYDLRLRKEAALYAAAKRYTNFLAQFGSADQGDIKGFMASLFADDCQKVVNGKVITRTVDELYNQLATAKVGAGLWSVNIVNVMMVNVEANKVLIHYEIPTEHIGTFVVMKFLTIDNGMITEINEVYNTLEVVAENLQQSK